MTLEITNIRLHYSIPAPITQGRVGYAGYVEKSAYLGGITLSDDPIMRLKQLEALILVGISQGGLL